MYLRLPTTGDIVSGLPGLRVLDLSGNPLLAEDTEESDSVGGFGRLVSSLSHAPSLSRLVLQGCGLTSLGLKSLGNKLLLLLLLVKGAVGKILRKFHEQTRI